MMPKTRFVFCVFAVLSLLLLFAPAAHAQYGSIAGVAKDSSGAVMAGVSVQAASPVMIEGQRTVTTGGDGRYAIVDLRPGTYTVTFTMQGFNTVKQQVEVSVNTTVPVDADMKVGSVGETVNVEATVQSVDIQNVAHPQDLTRDEMDAVPSARNMQSVASYTPGVHLNTPDPGGLMQVQQTYIAVHGNPSGRTTYLLDGLLINTTQGDGSIQTYVDNEIFSESTQMNNNVPVEVSSGGAYVNLIPKDGGNQLHGDLFLGWVNNNFVGSNVSQSLVARGLVGQSKVTEIQDFDGSLGGPIKKDKLWFLITGRKQLSNLESPGSFYPNGAPGVELDHIYDATARLTYQVNPKLKIATMMTRDWKYIGDDIVSGSGGFNDTNPLQASDYRKPVMYYIMQARITATPTPKLIFQGGWSFDKLDYNILNQPGIFQAAFSPAWYQNVEELDLAQGLRSISGGANVFFKFDRYVWDATGQYITGAHQIKFGIQSSYGPAYQNYGFNGDGYSQFNNGVPLRFIAYNTPVYEKFYLNNDLGIYGSDTWTFKRLSITGGIRWEYLNNDINPQSAPAGRFVGARNFPLIDCNTIKGLSCFKDWTPRLGGVYDVFGDHKTAIKGGIAKYDTPLVQANLQNFNPMYLTAQPVYWNGGSTPCFAKNAPAMCYPTGGFAPPGTPNSAVPVGQLGVNTNPSFGLIPNISLDPNFHREYDWQYNLGIQRQIWHDIVANFTWNRVSDYQQALLINYAVPQSAFTPYTITNPLNNSPVTVYNLQQQYVGVKPALHQTNAPQSLRSNYYEGFETSVTGRLSHGGFFNFGWTIERQIDKECDESATTGAALNDPNYLRFCDWSGGLYQNLGANVGIPFRNEFQAQANMPIKWGIEGNISIYSSPVFSTNYASYQGAGFTPLTNFTGGQSGFKQVNWTITPGTTYPMNCKCPNPGGKVDPNLAQGSEVVQLVSPGSVLTPRYNQVDIGFRKKFTFKEKYTLMGEMQIFNVFNVNTVLTESYALGSSVTPYLPVGNGGLGGGVPTVIANPRMLRLNLQFKF
jgi:hypothetical protein